MVVLRYIEIQNFYYKFASYCYHSISGVLMPDWCGDGSSLDLHCYDFFSAHSLFFYIYSRCIYIHVTEPCFPSLCCTILICSLYFCQGGLIHLLHMFTRFQNVSMSCAHLFSNELLPCLLYFSCYFKLICFSLLILHCSFPYCCDINFHMKFSLYRIPIHFSYHQL